MSKTTRRDLGGTLIFLAFAAVLLGLSVLTLRAVVLSGPEATAYLRVNREAVNGNAADFIIFKETQASLLKSTFVLNAALSSEALSQTDVTIQELAGNLRVDVDEEDELLCVQLTARRRDKVETKAILDAVLDAYRTEIVNKERLERVESLANIRKRYQDTYDQIVKETEQVKLLAERSGPIEESKESLQKVDGTLAELQARTAVLDKLRQELERIEETKTQLEIELDGPDVVTVVQQAHVQ